MDFGNHKLILYNQIHFIFVIRISVPTPFSTDHGDHSVSGYWVTSIVNLLIERLSFQSIYQPNINTL